MPKTSSTQGRIIKTKSDLIQILRAVKENSIASLECDGIVITNQAAYSGVPTISLPISSPTSYSAPGTGLNANATLPEPPPSSLLDHDDLQDALHQLGEDFGL